MIPGSMTAQSLRRASLLAAAVIALLPRVAPAETVPDRKGAVLGDRARLASDLRWIYNDYERAFAEGQRTGKPVLVVLRCIPCLACAGIDSAVLLENSSLAPLLDQFICVRVVNANALDLSRFQFDFDLSFSTLIFNGDGTLYGRFGSWSHQKDPADNATDGLKSTLERALTLHAGYPANKASLAGKQGRPSAFKTPIEMPTLQGKYSRNLDWEGKVVQSCVHCHQIGDALRADFRQRKAPLPPQLVYPFPPPETIGVTLDPGSTARIRSVTPGSPADLAGLKPDDSLVEFDSQPLISSADFSWVLHHAPASGTLSAAVDRGGTRRSLTVPLQPDWRNHADISRRVGTWGMRAMALGGLLLEDLPDADRKSLGFANDTLALRVKHVGEYNEHAAAKKAGFLKEDVFVAVNAATNRLSESELIGTLLARFQPGDLVKVTVQRGTERVLLQLPIQ